MEKILVLVLIFSKLGDLGRRIFTMIENVAHLMNINAWFSIRLVTISFLHTLLRRSMSNLLNRENGTICSLTDRSLFMDINLHLNGLNFVLTTALIIFHLLFRILFHFRLLFGRLLNFEAGHAFNLYGLYFNGNHILI